MPQQNNNNKGEIETANYQVGCLIEVITIKKRAKVGRLKNCPKLKAKQAKKKNDPFDGKAFFLYSSTKKTALINEMPMAQINENEATIFSSISRLLTK